MEMGSWEQQALPQERWMQTPSTIGDVGNRRRTVLLLSLLVVIWAIELVIIEDLTTRPSDSLSVVSVLKYAARRMVLNTAVCACLVCLLNRFWLYGTFIAGTVFSGVVTSYATYFHQPLSWHTVSNQWQEGISVAGHGVALVSWSAILVLLVLLAVKVALRELAHREPVPVNLQRKWGVVFGVSYVLLGVGFAGFYKPIRRVNVGSPEYTYGYAVAWAAECLTYDADAVLADAVAKSQAKSRRLIAAEPRLNMGEHLVIVQVESLDYDVVDAKVGHRYVMPFLRQLKSRSMWYMVKPFHTTGTSDADFSLLTSSSPNGRITPFKVVGFPYGDSLPWLTGTLGYTAVAIHGNTGAFFQRRSAYAQMGFSKLYFAEELRQFGVDGAADDEVLRFSARLIHESKQPMFHFVITLTSHGPFNQLPDRAARLIASPQGIAERYLNSMNYVDRSLAEYYAELPDNTTLVIYGDHHSNVVGYVAGEPHGDRVPWIICQKGRDISGRQRTGKTGLATSGALNQLDLVCYFRDCVESVELLANQATPAHSVVR